MLISSDCCEDQGREKSMKMFCAVLVVISLAFSYNTWYISACSMNEYKTP